MVDLEKFSRLVAGIYSAAVAPGQWQGAIHDVQVVLGGKACGLLTRNGAIWSFEDATLPADSLESYQQHYGKLDYAMTAVAAGPTGVVRTGREVIVPNRNWEFYTGWMRPNEIEDALFVRLTEGPDPVCFSVGATQVDFDTPDRLQLMRGLVPHLQQAIRTQNTMTALDDKTRDLTAALEMVGRGVIIVGSNGQVRSVNTAAETIIRASDGLSHEYGRIVARSRDTQHELQRALDGALRDDQSTGRRGHTMICPRPSAKRPYVIHVLPLHAGATDVIPRSPAALILIADPEREPESVPAMLWRLYGLTTAEAEVALRLLRGQRAKQIAEELAVSYHTVRSHLQHVFDKTQTHRQGELIRLLLALTPESCA
jgi:DNA-binding CsgD family transcriptional regulator